MVSNERKMQIKLFKKKNKSARCQLIGTASMLTNATPPVLLETGGNPATWLPPGRPVEQ